MLQPIFQPGVMPTWEEQNDVKCIPVAMTRAALDGDMKTLTDLMPGGYLDAINALGTCVLMLTAAIRAHVGYRPEDGQKLLDVYRDVIRNGEGL